MKLIALLGVCLATFLCGSQKVLIISHHHAQPFFVEIQAKAFQKFVQDDYEFVIFNDGKTPQIVQQIDSLCKKYNIRSIRINPNIHQKPYLKRDKGDDYNNPAVRCANVVQYSLDILGFDYNGPVVIIDSDMFPIKPLSFLEILDGYNLVAVPQKRPCGEAPPRVRYIWNGLIIFDMPNLPEKKTMNFNCGIIEGCNVDVGGYMHYYLLKHQDELRVRHLMPEHFIRTIAQYREGTLAEPFYNLIPLIEMDAPDNMETFLDGTLLHYRSGGLWQAQPVGWYEKKNEIIKTFMSHVLNDSTVNKHLN